MYQDQSQLEEWAESEGEKGWKKENDLWKVHHCEKGCHLDLDQDQEDMGWERTIHGNMEESPRVWGAQ